MEDILEERLERKTKEYDVLKAKAKEMIAAEKHKARDLLAEEG